MLQVAEGFFFHFVHLPQFKRWLDKKPDKIVAKLPFVLTFSMFQFFRGLTPTKKSKQKIIYIKIKTLGGVRANTQNMPILTIWLTPVTLTLFR